MKTSAAITTALIIGSILLFQSSYIGKSPQKGGSIYTADVKKVIDSKCYGCHSAAGDSRSAKFALLWDSLPNLPKNKLVAALDDIVKVLRKNEMPPASAVKRYPELKMLPEESRLLQSWAVSRADSLLK
jgi:hypothetical protein